MKKYHYVLIIILSGLVLNYLYCVYTYQGNLVLRLSSQSLIANVDMKVMIDGEVILDTIVPNDPHGFVDYPVQLPLGFHSLTVESNKGNIRAHYDFSLFYFYWLKIDFHKRYHRRTQKFSLPSFAFEKNLIHPITE